jgi:TatD DNase family protein
MHSTYIDIHTHSPIQREDVFQLPNIIIGKDPWPATYCSAGIHPRYIDTDIEMQFDSLAQFALKKNVVALGECGFDKLADAEWKLQVSTFQYQIALAEELNKPLIIHCVRAYQETLHLLNKTTMPAVFHGFNKKIELARQILQQGHCLSLGADILYGRMDEHIRELPLDRIFFETDGKAISIIDIYTYFCSIRKITPEQLREQIGRNFEKVFNHIAE